MSNKNSRRQDSVGVWHMLRDVLMASMNKGQFPFAMCALIFLVMLVRMPAADVSKLMFHLVDLAERNEIAGWVVAFLSVFGWYWHSRRQRRTIVAELERLTEERNNLQLRLIGNDRVKSSEKRK